MTTKQATKASGFVAVLADDYRREYEAGLRIIKECQYKLKVYDSFRAGEPRLEIARAITSANYSIREAKRNYQILTGDELK